MARSNRRTQALTLIVAAVGLRLPTAAQAPIQLNNDHPIVIEHLIALHGGLSAHIRARDAEDPANAASRQDGAMRIFGVGPAGYRTLETVLSAAKVRLDAVRASRSQYITGATSGQQPGSPDSARLRALYQQELSILQGVPAELKARLSSDDWTSLQAFIAAELVAKIQVGPAMAPRAPNTP